MMVMKSFNTKSLRKFWTSFSFCFGFDVSRKNGFGASLFLKTWFDRFQFLFGFQKFSRKPGFYV